MTMFKRMGLAVAGVVTVVVASGCAGGAAFGQQLNEAFNGVSATWESYGQAGQPIDRYHGVSFRVSRDDRFDTTDINSDGTVSTVPGEVLLVSVGNSHISHVGSSACLVQDGIVRVDRPGYLVGANFQPGTPWINDLREKFQNLWQGKAKTVIIRSQDGLPIAVYAGNNVEIFATDVPKSTWFRIDGKYLWCYRVDYSVPDTDLLQ